MRTVLLTGAGGFTGAHVLRHLLMNTDWRIICPVTFRHRGNTDRIASALQANAEWHARVLVDMCDLAAPIHSTVVRRWGTVDYILNVASESHVDRSITDPVPFVRNNTDLILNVLEYARQVQPRLVLQMSTDEVYGPAPDGVNYREWDPIVPSNPYSASKAAQEALAVSYWRTYGVPLIITNTMNLYGEMQDTEKYFAKVLRCITRGDAVPVHVSPEGEPGSRFYIHARNFADAWLHLIRLFDEPGYRSDFVHQDGHVGPLALPTYVTGADRPARYHIVGEREVNNLELAMLIAEYAGVSLRWQPVDYHSSRPGHDLRYALNGQKLANTGWHAPVSFEESAERTVRWTLDNSVWL